MVAQRRPLTTGESSRGMATSLTVRPSIMVIILAGRDRRETACRDGPRAVVEACDVDVVCKSDGIGQRVTPVATGSGRRVAKRHIDLHQLLDGQPLEVMWRRFRSASVGAGTTMMARGSPRIACAGGHCDRSGAQQ